MIKAVFFDFDGVLTDFECGAQNVCHNLHNKTGIPLERLLACYNKYGTDLNLGKITHKDMWDDFCKCVGAKVNIKLLDYAFRATPLNNGMFDLAGRLRKNYKIGIITDNSKERFYAIVNEYGLRDAFDALIISADIGDSKQGAGIFARALEAFDVKSDSCIFIDNSRKNLEVPKRMGFKTIYYDFERFHRSKASSEQSEREDFEKKDANSLLMSLKALGIDG